MNPYLTQWRAREYLETFYSIDTIPDETRAVLSFLVEQVRASSGQWRTALDFGCGPTIWGALPIAPVVRDVHIADYLQSNLDEIQAWLDCSLDAHDWRKHVQCVLELEGKEPDLHAVRSREQLLRDRVRRLIRWDIRDASSAQESLDSYDLIVSLYCLECISDSFGQWQKDLIKLGGLVAPGGLLLMASILAANEYFVGSQTFEMTKISERDIYATLVEAGFDETRIEVKSLAVDAWKREGFDQIALVVARR